MGFLQASGRMRLALKALAEHRVVRHPLGQQLQRDDAVLFGVLGFVDFAHAAAPDQPAQSITTEIRTLT